MFINILFTGCQLELVRSISRLASPFLTRGLNQGRVHTLEFFKFHDFFDNLFHFSMTFGLAVFFEKFETSLVLPYFFTLNSSTETNSGIHQNFTFTLFNFSSLSYVTLALSSAVTNLPNKTIIFHDFHSLLYLLLIVSIIMFQGSIFYITQGCYSSCSEDEPQIWWRVCQTRVHK